jgi:4-hydroxy-tetrahydrodipicolinate synthase
MFGSLLTAMITPFKKDGGVDFDEAVRIANYLADTGTDTVVLAGTTGESPTLTHEEERTLFSEVKKGLGKKAKVMAGTGSNSTATAIEATQRAEKLGIDASLLVVPYYNRPSQEGLYQHFKAIATSTSLPIMLYNIPGRTGRNMEVETTLRLTAFKNIMSMKEASGDLNQMKTLIDKAPRNFLVYSGDDGLTLDLLKLGGVGVVSVASHIAGKKIKEMIAAFTSGNVALAEKLNTELQPLFKVLFIAPNPVPVKEAMNMIGFHCGQPRLPLVPLTPQEREQVATVIEAYAPIKVR